MSWSLRLHHGDFVLSGSQFATATNEIKLTQDLRCALLERMGTDDMHTDFGSLIDGGIDASGNEVPGIIGTRHPSAVALAVQSEIERIGRFYQNQQLLRAKNDRIVYNRVSLSPNEVLISIVNINMEQVQDVLNAIVTLQTARSQNIQAVFPLATNT